MPGFGERPLAKPVVLSRTSNQCRPTRLDIRGDEKILRVEYRSGTGTGNGFTEHSKGNITLANLPDDEDENPQPQEWDDFMSGAEIAAWCKAQPPGTTNGAVLKKLANFLLGQKGVI